MSREIVDNLRSLQQLVRQINNTLCKTTSSQSEIDPEVVCLSNDGGVTVIKGVVEFDTSTAPATKIIYLFDGNVATGYTVVPCNAKTFDTEFREVCVDGQKWLQILVFDKSVSMVAPVQIGWMDETSTVVPAPNLVLINNINCNECISTTQGILINWG